MKTLEQIKLARPEIAVTVTWEHDPDFEWDADGPDPQGEGYLPYNVTVTAYRVANGDLIRGQAHLGGCYSANGGQDDPEVSGYLPQLVREAVSELDRLTP